MVHHCRELVQNHPKPVSGYTVAWQDLHCSHLCKLYSRLGITDMIEAGGRFVHVDTHVPNEEKIVTFSFISIFDIRIFRYSHPRLMHTHDSWFLPDLPLPGNLHDCWWCLSQLTSQNDRWRGPLIHHRFGIGWPSWTQLNSVELELAVSIGKCFISAACEELDKSQLIWAALSDSNVKICMAGVTCALMVWSSLGGGRLRDIQEFLMWIFMHIFPVHQWILFLYSRSWSSFSSPSLMKSPKVECLVLKVPHQDEDFQDFLLVFKPMYPMNPFNSCLCEVSCFFWCFHLRLLSVIAFWIWCSAWNLGIAIRAIRDRKWRQAKPSSFGPFPVKPRVCCQAVKPHCDTLPDTEKAWDRGKERIETSHEVEKSIRSHNSFGGSPPEII